MSSHRKTILIAALALVVFLTSGFKASEESSTTGDTAEKMAPVVTKKELLGQLPCFTCHDLESFYEEEKPAGVFSHKFHANFEIHCNQCHEVKGHMPIELNGATCRSCHALDRMTYKGGGMGKVRFSHDLHTQMFGCRECHQGTFKMKKGATKITMDLMYSGKSCGTCHNGTVAFDAQGDCMACHRG